MRLNQQVALLVLLSLFLIGICLPSFCMVDDEENQQIPLGVLFGEIEEDESKEELEKLELMAAPLGVDAVDVFLPNSKDYLPEILAIASSQFIYQLGSPRAPPAIG